MKDEEKRICKKVFEIAKANKMTKTEILQLLKLCKNSRPKKLNT